MNQIAYETGRLATQAQTHHRPQFQDDEPGDETPARTTPVLDHRILLIDDQALTRDCTEKWLSAAYAASAVVPVAAVEELTKEASAELRGRLTLIIYNLHRARASDTKIDGDFAALKRMFTDCPIIVVSDLDHQERVVQALQRGVRGYIPTNSRLEVAVEATRLVSAGGTFVPATSFLMQPSREGGRDGDGAGAFTQRQLAVLKCLREGKANKIIAHELSMSVSTVKVHVRNIMQKLKATNRTQVAYQTRQLFYAED